MAEDVNPLAAELASRAEIGECISMAAHAFDRRRWDLFGHIFHDDGRYQTPLFDGGWEEWVAGARADSKESLEMAHHQLGTALLRFEDPDRCVAETYATGHMRVRAGARYHGIGFAHDGPFMIMAGIRYVDRMERRDGRWRIAIRRAVSEWLHVEAVNDAGFGDLAASARGGFGEADVATAPLIAMWLHGLAQS